MLRVISAAALIAQSLFPAAPAGVPQTDAYARASGNRKALAVKVGRTLFARLWPAQVLNVYADGIAGHDVVGLRLSGVHFHHALTRDQFIGEIAQVAEAAMNASGSVEEVDAWVTIPLRIGRDIVVAGDLARPTSRTVFTVTLRRGESAGALERRIRQGDGVFWDQDWTRAALK